MLRRLLLVGFATVAIAACGGSSPTASPSSAPTDAPSAAPTAAPTPATTPQPDVESGPPTMIAACDAVGLRKRASSKGALVVRIAVGTQVRVVAIVPGDAYKVGSCGMAGDTWLKIDQVGGKSVKTLYGPAVVYAASGFFQ